MAWTTLNNTSKYILNDGDGDIILIRFSHSSRSWILTDTSMREMQVSDRAALRLLIHAQIQGYNLTVERKKNQQ